MYNTIIDDQTFKNNFYFYKILKQLIKCNFTESQINQLTRNINIANTFEPNMLIDYLLNNSICKKNTKKFFNYKILVDLILKINKKMWIDLVDLSINLIRIKNIIYDYSNLYLNDYIKKEYTSNCDILTVAYDQFNIDYPYTRRVLSSLLTYIITENTDNYNANNILKYFSDNKSFNTLKEKFKQISYEYDIKINNMFLLILDESISQSIKSNSGKSYEKRVEDTLCKIDNKVSYNSHDINDNSVEYDFIFNIEEYKIGVSAKRTLRERYKQNWTDVKNLNIDFLCLFSLGTDINENKLSNILSKNGTFIVIASDIYEEKDYFKNNFRVIPSNKFTKKNIIDVINKLK